MISLQYFRAIALGGILLASTACSLLPEQIDKTEGWSAQQFYTTAKEHSESGNYQTAARYYETLQARYPFGRYAQQAQLDLIHVYFKAGEDDQAVAAAERFIRTYPRHPAVDYAYYMRGRVNFTRGNNGFAERLLPSDPEKTDTSVAMAAFNDFAELVERFPDSRYAEDSALRMVYLRNNLAAYEIHVADYYMRRKAHVAAANRAKYVLENYARTPAAADALAILTEAYIEMGMNDLAADSLRVLALNHPDSPRLGELNARVNGLEYTAPDGGGWSVTSLLGLGS